MTLILHQPQEDLRSVSQDTFLSL